MPYAYLEEVATADVAFEAWGETLESLFAASVDATMNVIVGNLDSVSNLKSIAIHLEAPMADMLLFQLLQDLIFYKDAERLLLGISEIAISSADARWELKGEAYGEPIDPSKHEILVDVKAVTLHRFRLWQTQGSWRATVVLDM